MSELRCAFYGRVSSDDNQDPTLSLPRQLRNCQEAVERIGGEMVAHYYDIESGAMRFVDRGSAKSLKGLTIPIPREGGLPELLEESKDGGFDVVVCENINRFSRNPAVTFPAEEQLRESGVKLWPIDEPWEESFGSIVLRHVNVGVARGYIHELKVKSRQGIETATRQGRHAGGKPLYGYRFREETHPNPRKADQGQKVKYLEPDPVRAPIVEMIFEDYVTKGLSITDIQNKLNADTERYPPPESPDPARRSGQWGRSSVWEVLHNPKYTGYQVWNRRQRKRGGKVNPPEKWIWSEQPAHEALVSRELFDKTILIGSRRVNAAEPTDSHTSVRTKNAYLMRSFIKCGLCGLRMQGNERQGRNLYRCRQDQRPGVLVPDGHPPTVSVSENWVSERVLRFLTRHLFGPERLEALEELLDDTDPEAEQHQAEVAWLQGEIADLERKIERQMGHLEAEDPQTAMAKTLRRRLHELIEVKTKRERELKIANQEVAERTTREGAAHLLECLPLIDVDREMLTNEDFRVLLEALRFEARFEPKPRRLGISVTLARTIVLPGEDGISQSLHVPHVGTEQNTRMGVGVLYVPPAGHSLHLCRGRVRLRGRNWSSKECSPCRNPGGPRNDWASLRFLSDFSPSRSGPTGWRPASGGPGAIRLADASDGLV